MKCVVVGNAENQSHKGGLVDEFEIVVRLNAGSALANNSECIGVKTDIWSFSTIDLLQYQTWSKLFPDVVQWRVNGRIDYRFCGGFNGSEEHYKKFIYDYGFPRPSTGLITASYAIHRGYSVSVIGFDFFTTGTWYRSGNNHGPHDGKRERRYLEQIGVNIL